MKRRSLDEVVANSLIKKGQEGLEGFKKEDAVDIIIRANGTTIKGPKGEVIVMPNSIMAEIEGIGNVDVTKLISDYEDLHTESDDGNLPKQLEDIANWPTNKI